MKSIILKKLFIRTGLMLLISIPVLADIDTNSEAFQLYADTDRSQKPELIEQDNILIAKATHTFGTREHAAEGYVERGFNFYSEDKLIQSMEYFNQAWLLDNNNAYIYLGYGLIFKKNKQPCTATKQFQKANENIKKEIIMYYRQGRFTNYQTQGLVRAQKNFVYYTNQIFTHMRYKELDPNYADID